MSTLGARDVLVTLLGLGLLLGFARVLGDLARRLRQPSVLGELLAGVLLGPTVLGALAPGVFSFLYDASGRSATVIDGVALFGAALFLWAAGIEVELSTVWRQGWAALVISTTGIIVPFMLGSVAVYVAPSFFGVAHGSDPLVLSLVLATALAISSLPVIAKTLMDLRLYRSDFGMTVITAAIVDDLVGWIIFAFILGISGRAAGRAPAATMALTLAFILLTLTVVRWAVHRALGFLQAHGEATVNTVGLAIGVALLSAALAEWIGVHAVFGAFIFGVALGDSPHLREQSRSFISEFVAVVFAPLFFASIGLRLDFTRDFDLGLTLVVLALACAGKLLGCLYGARLARLRWREGWAVGFAMNGRGAMAIILGLLALQAQLIGRQLFVALVVTALVTSAIGGPAIARLLSLERVRHFVDLVTSRAFVASLKAVDSDSAIRELGAAAAEIAAVPAARVIEAVLAREALMPTALGGGVAIPHAYLPGLRGPVVAIGLSRGGIDFNAPDGEPARLIVLLLNGIGESQVQLELLADVARTFEDRTVVGQALAATSHSEFIAAVTGTKRSRERGDA